MPQNATPSTPQTATVKRRGKPLQAQLSRWEAAGLLSAEQVAAIAEFEAEQSERVRGNRWALTLSLLGALVLGLGLIALVAANWGQVPQSLKLLGLVALMLGSYGLGYRLRDAAGATWQGTGAALYLLGGVLFGALLALLSQGLQLDVPLTTLLMLWGVGLLALAYAVRLPAALHLALPLGAIVPLLHLYDAMAFAGGGAWSHWWPLLVALLVSGFFLAITLWHDQSARSPDLHALGHPWAFWFPPLFLLAGGALTGVLLFDTFHVASNTAGIMVEVVVGVLALGLAYLGGKLERRAIINWGLLGVGAAVLALYFSLFTRLLSISLVLIGAGLLLLGGGYLLERTRRRLTESLQ